MARAGGHVDVTTRVRMSIVFLVAVAVMSGAAVADEAPVAIDGLLVQLAAVPPEDDPTTHIELARRVLAQIEDGQSTTVEAEVRAGLGRALRLADRYREAVVELEIAADLAWRTDHPDLLADILADLARARFHLGDFDDCLTACRSALALPQIADDPDRSWLFENIVAVSLLQKGSFEEAIETSSRVLEGRLEVGDQNAAAILLNNIGVAHMYLGDYEPALEYLHRARTLKTEIGETAGIAEILANMGDIKTLQGLPEEAIDIHREALRMRQEEGGDFRIAQSHRSLAAALHGAGREPEALRHAETALEGMRELGADPEVVAGLAIRAEILAALGRGEEAVASAEDGLELVRTLGMRGREIVALDAMVEAQQAVGNTDAAFEFLAESRRIENELKTAEIRRAFTEFQTGFEARTRQNEIDQLTRTNEAQTRALRGARMWRNALAVGFAVMAVVIAVLCRRALGRHRETDAERRAEAARLQRDERFRMLFDRSPAGIIQTDRNGKIRTANPAFAAMLGHDDPAALDGMKLDSLAADPVDVRRFFADLEVHIELQDRELVLLDRNGERVPVMILARFEVDPETGETVAEGMVIDVSERARAEAARRRSESETQQNQKLESLGILAGGIAHDFNNTLMAILSNISLAKRRRTNPEEALDHLSQAEEACIRATSLTQQLLTFSKGGRPIRRTASIARLIEESAAFAVRGSNSSIDFRSATDLWPAEIDEGQIGQVIQSLVDNAMEAMPYGGTITVTVDNAHVADGDVPSLEAGRFVRIEVTDTGDGIADDDLDLIFDPFYTTRPGRAGLGLATAFSIVRSHGGALVVHSKPGEGSRFAVLLPAADSGALETEPPPSPTIAGTGRLLIMDDDEAVRTAAAELLSSIGYVVTPAADGAEAVELYTAAMESGYPFDAVVLDLTVPDGVGGRETMSRLLAIDPKVKAIVSSGYSTDPVMANYREHGFSGVAVKPYRLADLAGTLQRILES